MYCPNCEFEIKGEGRKKCPICGGVLVEFSELESSLKESKTSARGETTEELSGTGSMAEQKSVEDDLAEVLEKYDPDKGRAAGASEQTKLKPKRSSKLSLAILVIVMLVLTVAIVGGIFFLKFQQGPSPMVAQLKTKTTQDTEKVSGTIVKKEQGIAVAKKESAPADTVQKTKSETPPKKTDKVKEVTPATVKKDETPSGKKETEPAAVKKEKSPADHVEETTPTGVLYSIHVSSHKTKEAAASEVNRLKKLGFDAYLQTATLKNGEVWHRVKVGDFNTRRKAQKIQNKLIQKDPQSDSYIAQRTTNSEK